MVRPIVKDPVFLGRRSEPAGPEDRLLAADLLETLQAHADECVGMAANMIGELKRVITFSDEGQYRVLYNPEIIRRDGPYEAEEGCLSLAGTRKARRWKRVKVRYENEAGQVRMKTFSGFTAQIVQHEIDHCDGIRI